MGMSALPETRYAKSGDVHVAYQVLGDGPVDLVFVPPVASHLELQWEEPLQARFFRRLASFCRLIRFDKRGQGLSDRTPLGSIDERMDDIRAVMDAAGSERAGLMAWSESGPISTVFAATHPERVESLILVGTFARALGSEDWSWGLDPGVARQLIQIAEDGWGSGFVVDWFVPSADDAFKAWFARFERFSVSPGAIAEAFAMDFDMDVRAVLPVVQARTLVMHSRDDHMVDAAQAKYLAEHLPQGRYVELPGADHFPWAAGPIIADEVEQFLTGKRRPPEIDRVLATILFTDIVDSTKRAAEIGDRGWHELLDRHHNLVRAELDRFRGREIKNTGDGFLAAFDGPARAVRCGLEIRDGVRNLGLDVRAGVHTGECEFSGEDVAGIAVHIGSRVAALARSGEVLVSNTVKDLVTGSAIQFSDRGTHELKGALICRRHPLTGPAEIEERQHVTAKAVQVAEAAQERELSLRASAFRIIDLMEVGDIDEADREYQAFETKSEALRQPVYRYLANHLGNERPIREGRFGEADQLTPVLLLTPPVRSG
jgi:pimeloyl-ACP methyl ester carboxylesterase/class 3 adenylate cyclase